MIYGIYLFSPFSSAREKRIRLKGIQISTTQPEKRERENVKICPTGLEEKLAILLLEETGWRYKDNEGTSRF